MLSDKIEIEIFNLGAKKSIVYPKIDEAKQIQDYINQIRIWKKAWQNKTGKNLTDLVSLANSYFSIKDDSGEDVTITPTFISNLTSDRHGIPTNHPRNVKLLIVLAVFYRDKIITEDEITYFIQKYSIPIPEYIKGKGLFTHFDENVLKSSKGDVPYKKRHKHRKVIGVVASFCITIMGFLIYRVTCCIQIPCSDITPASSPIEVLGQSYLLYLPNVVNSQASLLNPNIRSLGANQQGIWIGYFAGTIDGVSNISQQSNQSFTWQHCLGLPIKAGQNINNFAFKGNTIFLATDGSGIVQLDRGGWNIISTNDGIPDTRIYHLFKDTTGALWASTFNGVARQFGDKWQPAFQADENRLSGNHIYEYLEDTSGNRWFGLIDRGISRLEEANNQWYSYYTDITGLQNIRGIVEDNSGNIWFASDGGGVILYQNGNMTIFDINSHDLISNNIYDIEKDKFGRIWIATSKGISYTDNNGQTWQTVTTTRALDIQFGCAGCSIDDNHLWIALSEGLGHMIIPSPRG